MIRSDMLDYFSRLAGISFSQPIETKIWNFRHLADGWHSGEGVQFKEREIFDAINLHSEILNCGFLETDAFPGFNGEIRITLYSGENYFEFTLEPDGKWTFVHEREDKEIQYKELLTFQEAIKIVRSLEEQQLWNTSGFFHVTTGTEKGLDFKAWLSNLRPVMEEFPSLISSVPSAEVETFVDISEPFTIIYQMNHQFFVSSQATYFRKGLPSLKRSATEEMTVTGTSRD